MAPLTTEETLNSYHNKKCIETEASGTLFDYLMDCQSYLKTMDLEGWKKAFLPPPPRPPQKRLKQSPLRAATIPEDPCKECESENVLRDVQNGQVVCLECGLIQSVGVSMACGAHSMSRESTGNRYVYIHLYSRKMYFHDIMRFCHGDSRPQIDIDRWVDMHINIDITDGIGGVEKYLKDNGLTTKLRRHKWSILQKLGGKPLLNVPPDKWLQMYRMFRIVEYYWKYYGKQICPGRKVFYPYYILIYQFGRALDLVMPESLMPRRLKDRIKHVESYRLMCKYTKFRCFS